MAGWAITLLADELPPRSKSDVDKPIQAAMLESITSWPNQPLAERELLAGMRPVPGASAGPLKLTGELTAIFALRPHTCSQALNEADEFARLVVERYGPKSVFVVVLETEEANATTFVRGAGLQLPTFFESEGRASRAELTRFDDGTIEQQLILYDGVAGRVVARVGLGNILTSIENKNEILDRVVELLRENGS